MIWLTRKRSVSLAIILVLVACVGVALDAAPKPSPQEPSVAEKLVEPHAENTKNGLDPESIPTGDSRPPRTGAETAAAEHASRQQTYDYSSAISAFEKWAGQIEKTPRKAQDELHVVTDLREGRSVPRAGGNDTDEIVADEGHEVEEVVLPPLSTFIEKEHLTAVAQMLNGMKERYEHFLTATVLEETREFLAKVQDMRHHHIERFNKVIGNNQFAYLRPLRSSRLLHLHPDTLRGLHTEHNAATAHIRKSVWGDHYASGEVVKIKRLHMINYGFASATYAVSRVFPYALDPDDRRSRTVEQDGALKVFVVKRGRIEPDLAEELLLHQARAWRYFPPERAEELAETEGLLIPVSLLKLLDEDEDAKQRDQDDRIDQLLGSKGDILNAFLLYPRSYACTLKFFFLSWGRTDLLVKTAPLKAMISISIQMVYAVASLNSYGLVHGHIRPSSFVMTPDGKVLLSDFHTIVEEGIRLSCRHKSVPSAADLNSSPEELACSQHDEEPRQTFEATFALDAWRLGVSLFKLWCRESWREPKPDEPWAKHLTTRQVAFLKAQKRGRTTRARLDLEHCRSDTPSFILRVIQQFLEPNPDARLTAVDAVKGASLFRHMERRMQAVREIRETMMRQRGEEL
ncbi:rhoptry kinase family protein ROP36 (incomplete catalytic triad) [Besnoitia besnoiti]|uniref:Rhoptry kinase family protein ROP36 (Incomplete catalytic triad) n=1 Tax=Besnoitia besnoiti TaxID=94643 RepID=A0A2A9M5Z8_BESBE|nr:rhoptry kinase family protein ROP36 (incomplete catalytic triad) [Besnoitia besnoiti]PFH31741.1 rhoptry kinase family protein ROP36 (incomplete catalytic triad) [Besnoitia besnoiti]